MTDIESGEEYKLVDYNGSTVRVRAESEVWENSKGIRGFDATLLEDFGGKEAGDFKIMRMHHYDVVGTPVQCEGCDGWYPEEKMNVAELPAATLAFCDGCAKQTRAEELGVKA